MKFLRFLNSAPELNRRRTPIPIRTCVGVERHAAGTTITVARRTARGKIAWLNLPLEAARHNHPASICLSVADSVAVWLDVPFSDWRKNRRVLPALLDTRLPFSLEDCCFDFVATRHTAADKTQVLAIAARRVKVENLLEPYRADGWQLVMLDHLGLALWTQSLFEHPQPAEQTRVIIYLQPTTLSVVVGQGENFQQAHALTFSIAPDLNAQAQELAHRLERLLQAELNSQSEMQWMVIASEHASVALADALTQHLTHRRPAPVTVPQQANTFLARALARRALSDGAWRCDLSATLTPPHPMVSAWQAGARRRITALLLATGLILFISNGIWHLTMRQHQTELRRAIAVLAAKLAPDARIPYGRELEEARRACEVEHNIMTKTRAVLNARLHQSIGALTALAQQNGVSLLTLHADDQQVEIVGNAADWHQCEAFEQALRTLTVETQLQGLPVTDDGRAAFKLKGLWQALEF